VLWVMHCQQTVLFVHHHTFREPGQYTGCATTVMSTCLPLTDVCPQLYTIYMHNNICASRPADGSKCHRAAVTLVPVPTKAAPSGGAPPCRCYWIKVRLWGRSGV
jgi:hypothetical protein